MAESRDDIARELERKLAEKMEHERVIADTRALLERVDERRRSDAGDRRRWEERAAALETTLTDARRRLSLAEQSIADLGKRMDGLRSADAASPALAPGMPPAESEPLTESRRKAANKVLAPPVFLTDQVSLEDLALAKGYLDSIASRTMPRDQREELARRIAIYDRRAERERLALQPRMTFEERRKQILLRQVIDKCRGGAFATLTLNEIDLLIHSYDLLVQQAGSKQEEDRLLEVIDRAVDEICARWASLDRLRLALKSRG